MPFSSGTFSLASGNPVTTGTTISSTWANNTLSDLATGMSTCLLKDGTQTVTANIPMAGFKFTGMGAGSAAGDSVRYEQVFNSGTLALIGSVSVTGNLAVLGSASVSGALNVGTTLFAGAGVSASGNLAIANGHVNWAKAATLTATATLAIGAVTGNYAVVTGTATVSSFDSFVAGAVRIIEWSGATPIENNSAVIVPGGANITTAAGDLTLLVSEGAGSARLLHQKASGAPISMSPITASLTGNVALNNAANFFDGPTIAQGTAGTWFVSGAITVKDTSAAAQIYGKLWDGTTVIDSGVATAPGTSQPALLSLSGYIANPVGNLRISAKDITSTSGSIVFNESGDSKDSTITAIRIA